MKTHIKKKTNIVMLMLCLLLSACSPYESWKQKITVVVMTPKGEKSGSSVISISTRKGYGKLSHGGSKIEGEAVAIRLDDNEKYVFAIWTGCRYLITKCSSDKQILKGKLQVYKSGKVSPDFVGIHNTRTMNRNAMPNFVTFRNINRPNTIVEVGADSFENAFGIGYYLKSVTIEFTNEAITKGVLESILSKEVINKNNEYRQLIISTENNWY